MPIYFRGNYLLAGRVAYGVLNDDNYTAGFSLGYGRTLDTMGYKLREPDPRDLRQVGVDFAFLRDNVEHRFDLLAGKWLGADTLALMYRLGVLFGPEQRLKAEVQPTYWNYWRAGEDNWLMSVCFSAIVTPDITFRTMYEYNWNESDHRVIGQLYFYKPL